MISNSAFSNHIFTFELINADIAHLPGNPPPQPIHQSPPQTASHHQRNFQIWRENSFDLATDGSHVQLNRRLRPLHILARTFPCVGLKLDLPVNSSRTRLTCLASFRQLFVNITSQKKSNDKTGGINFRRGMPALLPT